MPREFHIREQLRSVVKGYPLWPGDTISHEGARECQRRGWIVRQGDGNWIPTAKGLAEDGKPMPENKEDAPHAH